MSGRGPDAGPQGIVTVVGCHGGELPAGAAEAVRDATLVAGGRRHLSTVDGLVPAGAERLVLGDVARAVERIAAHGGPAAVFASGDPGFFGIVRALRAAGVPVRVYPAPSSVAIAFARAGLPWDDALVVSAHGRDAGAVPGRALRRAVNACLAHPKVAVLTGPGTGPAEVGAALEAVLRLDDDPPRRRLLVAERLGAADERVVPCTAGEAAAASWAAPTVVLSLGEAAVVSGPGWVAGAHGATGGWALPDDLFAHRMITKAEVRAVVLARLGPRVGDLVWDVGAGSGSVAVECARLGAAALAVERDPAAVATIRANARDHAVPVVVVSGSAPDRLAGLPDPDAVYVGGGGLSTLEACLSRRPSRLAAGYAALERVGPALAAMRAAGYRAQGVQVQANRLAELPDGTHRLAATNPVYVLSGVLS